MTCRYFVLYMLMCKHLMHIGILIWVSLPWWCSYQITSQTTAVLACRSYYLKTKLLRLWFIQYCYDQIDIACRAKFFQNINIDRALIFIQAKIVIRELLDPIVRLLFGIRPLAVGFQKNNLHGLYNHGNHCSWRCRKNRCDQAHVTEQCLP